MPKKFLPIAILLFVCIILQLSFFSAVPFLKNINFTILIILYLSIKNNRFYIPAAIVGGGLLDFFSSFIFGTHLLAVSAIALLSNYIYLRVLTNRRFFSFAVLAGTSIFFYHAIIWLIVFALTFLKISSRTNILHIDYANTLKEALFSVSFLAVLYLLPSILRKEAKVVSASPANN